MIFIEHIYDVLSQTTAQICFKFCVDVFLGRLNFVKFRVLPVFSTIS